MKHRHNMAWTCIVIIWSSLMHLVRMEYYLPTIVWDTRNPILQRQHWHNVVHLKTFDIVTFVCPNTNLHMAGSERVATSSSLNHNLYVKEIPANIKDFDAACTINGSKSIATCNKANQLAYTKIQISPHQAVSSLPSFKHGKDYMFFATSDGTVKSFNRTKICTMVFRIHYNKRDEERVKPSCFLLGRKAVCEKKATSSCTENIRPQDVTTSSSNTSVDVRWSTPLQGSCNVTGYGVRYGEEGSKVWQELIVPTSDKGVTLHRLKPATKYRIQIKPYTCTYLGNYVEVVADTDTHADNPPVVGAQGSSDGALLHLLSLFIGILVGIFLSATVIAGYCWYVRHRKDKCKEPHAPKESGNNAVYYSSDENNPEEVALNTGYRDSGFQQGWKLPEITEEERETHSSDA